MSHRVETLVLILAVLAIAAIVFLLMRKQRSLRLKKRFGPEYDRVLKSAGDARKAEAVLEIREKRREKFTIHSLSPAEVWNFASRWNDIQSRFVDDPQGSIAAADSLVTEAMQGRGYPVGEFEQRAADISVDHPLVVENYRSAHEIAARQRTGKATTEDLRQAMVHYRVLFGELLEQTQIERKGA